MTKSDISIGVVCLDTSFDKIPGHIRNPVTFDFPVKYQVVSGATPERLISAADRSLIKPFIEAAQELERQGVAAVTGSCGFLVLFQKEIADSLSIPFFSSSVLQLPMVHRLMAAGKKVGLLVANNGAFTTEHLRAIGAENVPLAIAGMEDQPEFRQTILEGRRDRLDVEKLKQEVLFKAKELIADNPDIAAIVLECTDLPPFAAEIQRQTNRPVFDAVTLTRMVHSSLAQRDYAPAQ
jgi:aspartate/glutamate racemase